MVYVLSDLRVFVFETNDLKDPGDKSMLLLTECTAKFTTCSLILKRVILILCNNESQRVLASWKIFLRILF